MKIREEIVRDCCQPKDLKPIENSPKVGYDPLYKFCVHCGAHHRGESVRDAAGGTDWVYRLCVGPWINREVT